MAQARVNTKKQFREAKDFLRVLAGLSVRLVTLGAGRERDMARSDQSRRRSAA